MTRFAIIVATLSCGLFAGATLAQEKATGTVVKPVEGDPAVTVDDGPRGTAKLRRLTHEEKESTAGEPEGTPAISEPTEADGKGMAETLPPTTPGPKRLRVPGSETEPEQAEDPDRAFAYAREAYERGDMQEAAAIYRDLAEAGDALAMYALGRMHARGDGVEKDEAEAFAWFMRSAEAGNADAQFSVSFRLWEGRGTPVDKEAALAWTKVAAEAGQPNAQYNWAFLHEHGEGVEADLDTAVRYYRLAADQGLAKAQNALAALYLEGEGVERDPRRAEELFRDAASQGIAGAAEKLDALVEDRHAEKFRAAKTLIERKEFEKARAILEPLAAEGHPPSLNELGIMAFWGFGQDVDKAAAIELFQKAGTLGHPSSQANLGMLYLKGAGVERDLQVAYAWLLLAEEGGVGAAKKGLEVVRRKMTPGQLTAAKDIADRIRSSYAEPVEKTE